MYPMALGKSSDSTLLASFYGMGKELGGGGRSSERYTDWFSVWPS